MKTDAHFWSYLVQLFLKWEMFQKKFVEKIENKFCVQYPPPPTPPKSCPLRENIKKYDTAGQATDGNIIRRMRMACWTLKATNKHSEYVTDYFSRLYESALILSLHVRFLSCFRFILIANSKPDRRNFIAYKFLCFSFLILCQISDFLFTSLSVF